MALQSIFAAPVPRIFDLVSNTSTHAARTRTGTHALLAHHGAITIRNHVLFSYTRTGNHHALSEALLAALFRRRPYQGRSTLFSQLDYMIAEQQQAAAALEAIIGSEEDRFKAAAMSARRLHPDTVIVSRFAGTTPQFSDTASLLRSICRELARAYGADEGAIPQAPEALPAHFRFLLGHACPDRPLMVFVDALDQLADVDEDAQLSWIPEELPPYVRLYVSALPTMTGAVHRVVPAESLLVLDPLSPTECDDLLAALLRDAGRRLTKTQMEAVVTLMLASPFPLYIRLLVEQVRHWRSDAGVPTIGRDVRRSFAASLTTYPTPPTTADRW